MKGSVFDRGSGPALVVVQPLQGRWEWTAPLLRELSRRARVVSYSLCGDLGSGRRMSAGGSIDEFVTQLKDVMDETGIDRAALCGISFGGAVAVRFAACFPDRVSRLIVASSPGPGWRPNAIQAGYVARPWLSLPAFAIGALGRVLPEVISAIGTWRERLSFALRCGLLVVRYPALPHLMARRVRVLERLDLDEDCARVAAPTLVLAGEQHLDRVVDVESTRRYAERIRGARYVKLAGTGHLGTLTQPKKVAAIVSEFVNAGHS
jgi:3-oxoadipate enol-lactonase